VKKNLNLPGQLIYAAGSLGHSAMLNILNLQLVYFFVPPQNSGIPISIKQLVFLGIFNTVSIIIASGRLWAAFIDPLVAHKSDRTKSRFGRRIPFMAASILPAAISCILIFFPPVNGISNWNILWLIAIQLIFFFSISLYITPYMSLLPELGHTEHQRINLTTYMSILWALGMMFASLIPAFSSYLSTAFALSPVKSFQIAIIIVCMVSFFFMILPILMINEKKYCEKSTSDLDLKEALKQTFGNQHFRFYIIADFIYMIALSMIMSGFIFFVTVLLNLSKIVAGKMMAYMVILSLVFYPLVNILAKKLEKKF
jgi:GPH family glycoside/pentoside/hexuronide:cation symporter